MIAMNRNCARISLAWSPAEGSERHHCQHGCTPQGESGHESGHRGPIPVRRVLNPQYRAITGAVLSASGLEAGRRRPRPRVSGSGGQEMIVMNSLCAHITPAQDPEQFVATPELHSDEAIDGDPLPPGQVWAIGPGSSETGAALFRIEVAVGPGSGAKILNHPQPPAFRESVKVGEQNLYARAKQLVGDRDPRSHEFSIQLRPFDADKSGAGLGLPLLIALVGGLLERSTRGATIVVGPLNLGGSIEMLHNPVAIAELAVDKQATTLLMPVAARRALNDLPDDIWTKINIEFYSDPTDGVFKGLME